MLNSKSAWYISGVSNRNRLDRKHLLYAFNMSIIWQTMKYGHFKLVTVSMLDMCRTPILLGHSQTHVGHTTWHVHLFFISSDTLGYVTDTRVLPPDKCGRGHVCMCFYDNQK